MSEKESPLAEIRAALVPATAWAAMVKKGRMGAVKTVTLPAEIVEDALSLLGEMERGAEVWWQDTKIGADVGEQGWRLVKDAKGQYAHALPEYRRVLVVPLEDADHAQP